MTKRKVLITGGNKGIGLAATQLFIEHGHSVVVVARDFTDFPLAKHELVTTLSFDLTRTADIAELTKQIGLIDILINNAGVMNSLPYDNYSSEKRDAMIKLNLEAPVNLIEHFSKDMIEQGYGRIVNLASIAGETGHPDIWYGITKAGVINFTKSFARLLGPHGIVVNAVAPGPVENTDLFHVIPEERRASLLKQTINGRFATPQDVAQTIYWLAVESPTYINGICVDVNNGILPR